MAKNIYIEELHAFNLRRLIRILHNHTNILDI